MSVFHEGRRLLHSQLIQVSLREKVELGGGINVFATFNKLKWKHYPSTAMLLSISNSDENVI